MKLKSFIVDIVTTSLAFIATYKVLEHLDKKTKPRHAK